MEKKQTLKENLEALENYTQDTSTVAKNIPVYSENGNQLFFDEEGNLIKEGTMKKQTAVNQIFAQIKAARKDTKFWNDSMLVDWLLEQEERYKQMEKEQIKNAFVIRPYTNFENYYNETYGGSDE